MGAASAGYTWSVSVRHKFSNSLSASSLLLQHIPDDVFLCVQKLTSGRITLLQYILMQGKLVACSEDLNTCWEHPDLAKRTVKRKIKWPRAVFYRLFFFLGIPKLFLPKLCGDGKIQSLGHDVKFIT